VMAGGYIEEIDIENGFYSGWDVNGRPLKLILDPKPRAVITDTRPQLIKLKKAILRYARVYDLEKPFICPKMTDNMIALFNAAEKHRESVRSEHWARSLWGRIINRIRGK